MIIKTKLFWFFAGRDASVHSAPYGFWIMWRPRPEVYTGRFAPIQNDWEFHAGYYSRKLRREYPLGFKGVSPFYWFVHKQQRVYNKVDTVSAE